MKPRTHTIKKIDKTTCSNMLGVETCAKEFELKVRAAKSSSETYETRKQKCFFCKLYDNIYTQITRNKNGGNNLRVKLKSNNGLRQLKDSIEIAATAERASERTHARERTR
uniref:(northern house mosquito) hypothetical protein n=1 Tax=Culex pipiens TaxID=7175 RepID=A0A8D8FGU5_CULPI